MRLLLSFCLSLLSFGCAGPMTPFGAMDAVGYLTGQQKLSQSSITSLEDGDDSKIKIKFLPEKQVLHGPSPFAITIQDPSGIPPEFELTMKYNGHDVTERFLSRAERKYLDPLHRHLKLSTRTLRLLPSRDNIIEVSYRRTPNSETVASRFQPPTCSAFDLNSPLQLISDFNPPNWIIHHINRIASENGFNPFYVAGLIAQESSFNPYVVSTQGALGLTQVTSLGEAEIIKKYAHWPRYDDLKAMSVPVMKLAILHGRINGKNEWRLNPALSIQGGVEYLNYLVDYWKRADKAMLVKSYLGESEQRLSEVILASYNSGAARVSRAIAERGTGWLKDEELTEAKKYVGRISSFCTHFQRPLNLGNEDH